MRPLKSLTVNVPNERASSGSQLPLAALFNADDAASVRTAVALPFAGAPGAERQFRLDVALPPARLSTLPPTLLQVRDAASAELLHETRLCAEGALADPATMFVRAHSLPATARQDQRCAFELDTLGAGSGPLLISVHSPMKSGHHSLHYRELAGGLRFTFTPTLAGVYRFAVRFGGNHHVLGSPFEIHVAGTRVTAIRSDPPETSYTSTVLEYNHCRATLVH